MPWANRPGTTTGGNYPRLNEGSPRVHGPAQNIQTTDGCLWPLCAPYHTFSDYVAAKRPVSILRPKSEVGTGEIGL